MNVDVDVDVDIVIKYQINLSINDEINLDSDLLGAYVQCNPQLKKALDQYSNEEIYTLLIELSPDNEKNTNEFHKIKNDRSKILREIEYVLEDYLYECTKDTTIYSYRGD